MKKVGEVLDEIKELDDQYKQIDNILMKMSKDEEVSNFMFHKVGIDKNSLTEIETTLRRRKSNLEQQLRETEIDIR